MSLTFLATSEFTLKRASIVSGKRGEASTVEEEIPCTPIEPSTEETVERAGLASPLGLYQFYTTYASARIGDVVESGNVVYQVRGTAPYEWPLEGAFTVVVIEDVKAPQDTAV